MEAKEINKPIHMEPSDPPLSEESNEDFELDLNHDQDSIQITIHTPILSPSTQKKQIKSSYLLIESESIPSEAKDQDARTPSPEKDSLSLIHSPTDPGLFENNRDSTHESIHRIIQYHSNSHPSTRMTLSFYMLFLATFIKDKESKPLPVVPSPVVTPPVVTPPVVPSPVVTPPVVTPPVVTPPVVTPPVATDKFELYIYRVQGTKLTYSLDTSDLVCIPLFSLAVESPLEGVDD